ncbi:unnamed protein product [Microthlaspi erraticum]|uniref:Uncharacterized protein n=1 Tax=Microthlaspi erraticum TaxID=1685480 RepID=A0A6D2KGA4_9BRAS|nr:unnamed protein product [Microthlaspi erraticum]
MGREEQGRTWCMDAAQLDTQRKKEEAILKTSSTTYSTGQVQLDRAEKLHDHYLACKSLGDSPHESDGIRWKRSTKSFNISCSRHRGLRGRVGGRAGLQDDFLLLPLRSLGLSKLFKLECSEYSQLTKEFLSTVALAFPNHNGDQPAAHDFKENSKRKQAAFADWTHFANEPFLPSRSKVSRITHPAIRYVHRLISTTFQCKQEANKTFINVRKLAQDLEGNKKLCVRFGRLITAIVLHVGIDIPNYEPLPKPTPLDLHALQHIHFLNRWTKDPTRFCYEFPIGPANTSLVLLPHEDIPSLRSGVVSFQLIGGSGPFPIPDSASAQVGAGLGLNCADWDGRRRTDVGSGLGRVGTVGAGCFMVGRCGRRIDLADGNFSAGRGRFPARTDASAGT